GLAQLGEHLLCKQGVVGSIPTSSTNSPYRLYSLSLWLQTQAAVETSTGRFGLPRKWLLFFNNSWKNESRSLTESQSGGKGLPGTVPSAIYDCVNRYSSSSKLITKKLKGKRVKLNIV